MLDLKFIRENIELVRQAIESRQSTAPLDEILKLDQERRQKIRELEDLRAAQKDLLAAKDLEELKTVFKKWRRIGWKNIVKMWLGERTPEQLKGEE